MKYNFKLPYLTCFTLLFGFSACVTTPTALTPSATFPDEVVTASIDINSSLRVIPPYFLGFSLEKDQLLTDEFTANNRVLGRLLKNLGQGTLRFGANTVDLMAYAGLPHSPSNCKITSTINQDSIKKLFKFSKEFDWKVIYGLNLGCNFPRAAAIEAKYVLSILQEQLLAFEVGNEPDLFLLQGLRTEPWNASLFVSQYGSYQKAILSTVPEAKLSGPGLGSFVTSKEWLPQFIPAETKGLSFASVHFYPTVHNGGFAPEHPAYPSISHLLNPNMAKAIIEKAFVPQIQLAHQNNLPFRITEMNSAARSGEPGVSDVFASALWVLDYSYRLLAAGIDGINIQNDLDNLNDIYSAIQREKNGPYIPRPIYYGMLMFHEAAKGTLVPVEIQTEAKQIEQDKQTKQIEQGGALKGLAIQSNLSIYASIQKDRSLKIILINKEPDKAVSVKIRVSDAQYHSGKVIKLLAPSLNAKSGISLGGASVDSDGSWQAKSFESIEATAGIFSLRVPPGSASLIISSPMRVAGAYQYQSSSQ